MLVAEDKDWTWVLDRACPDCGFDASACPPEAVAGLTRESADTWSALLKRGNIRGAPDRFDLVVARIRVSRPRCLSPIRPAHRSDAERG